MNCKNLKHWLVAAAVCASLSEVKIHAGPVTIPDFSFELWTNSATGFGLQDGATTVGPDVGTSWHAAGNGGVNLVNPTNEMFAGTTGLPGTLPAPADGTNYLFIGLGQQGYCWQTIGTFRPNTVYTLTVAVGNALADDGGQGSIGLVSGIFPHGTIVASAPVDSTQVPAGTFADTTLVFTTGQHASGPLTILLQGTGSSGIELIYDNVRLSTNAAPTTATALAPSASPDTNVYVGTVVTLTEDPAGSGPFGYQWQSDNGTGGAAFSNIPGANGTNLVVNTASFTSTPVEYQVVVTNSQGSSISSPVTITAAEGQPVIVADTLPSGGSDVVGSSVTFSAVFDGSRPITYQWQMQDTNGNPTIDIPGATNSTLTITNLQLTDGGFYNLVASNSLGVLSSTPALFAVNPAADPSNNVVLAFANQLGLGGNTQFTPSWTITTNNDLIAGLAPSTVGPGVFNDPQQHTTATLLDLTDGQFGTLYPQGLTSPDVVTGGTVGSGAGQYVIYTLPTSPTGYDITNVVTYGGWADAGRDEERYTLYYSTVAAPTNFTAFADVIFNPANPLGLQSATRVTITPFTGSALVKNVAALKFDFTALGSSAENGFVGFSEFEVYGTPSAAAPILAADTEPGSASDVEGDQVTFTATITGATSYQWLNINGGVTNLIPGATTQTLTLTNLQQSDTGTYLLVASNSAGTTVSSGSALTVNPSGNALLSGNGNVEASAANQTGRGTTYTPNWIIGTNNDLILGTAPAGNGAGVFNQENSGGISILTDGKFGSVGNGNNTSLATVGQGGGQSITYALNGPVSGFDISNIVTYGGWSDGGRDQQAYTVSYSTVQDPSTFIVLATVSFDPTLPGSVPSADRLTISSTSGPLAQNVARVQFDFTNPGIENGYGGLAEIGIFGVASAPIPVAPFITSDVVPATGSDVVGSQAIFTAAFNGTTPINYQWQVVANGTTNDVPGATGSTLTLTNLQLTDSGSYQLRASNSVGIAFSGLSTFTVNPAPSPDANGIIAAPANQTGNGGFNPTWKVASGSLIAGMLPSSVGVGGSFQSEGAGGLPVLTDGLLDLFGASVAGLATCGSGGGGHSITYTLPTSANGYNVSGIVSYAGWADGGRDQQAYTVSYSTVANPTTFIPITAVNYNPTLPGSVPSADRVTITSSTASTIATGVGAVKFDFLNPAGENGYSGYAEFQVFGASGTPAAPTVNPPKYVAGQLILTGTGGVSGGSYSLLTTTNILTPLANWQTNTTGMFDVNGAFSNNVPVSGSETTRFFLIKTP